MTVLEALIPLLASLGKIIADYATASAEKRAQLIAQADADYTACRDRILGLADKVAANDSAADELADKKPSGHSAPESSR